MGKTYKDQNKYDRRNKREESSVRNKSHKQKHRKEEFDLEDEDLYDVPNYNITTNSTDEDSAIPLSTESTDE